MKQLNYKRSTTEAISAKGTLSADGTVLNYVDDDKNECEVKVKDLITQFASQSVSITIKTQADEELELATEETNEE